MATFDGKLKERLGLGPRTPDTSEADKYLAQMTQGRKILAEARVDPKAWRDYYYTVWQYNGMQHKSYCRTRMIYGPHSPAFDSAYAINNIKPDSQPYRLLSYMFPRQYFYATQAYVRTAMTKEPKYRRSYTEAQALARVVWALDVLARVTEGLAATNIHPSVMAEMSLARVFVEPNLGGKFPTLPGALTSHPIYRYAAHVDRFKPKNATHVETLRNRGGIDLMALPAVMDTDAYDALYGASKAVEFDIRGCNPGDEPKGSYRKGDRRKIKIPIYSYAFALSRFCWFQPWTRSPAYDFQMPASWPSPKRVRAPNSKAFKQATLQARLWLLRRPTFMSYVRKYEPQLKRRHKTTTDKFNYAMPPGDKWYDLVRDLMEDPIPGIRAKSPWSYEPNVAWVLRHGVKAWAEFLVGLPYKNLLANARDVWAQTAQQGLLISREDAANFYFNNQVPEMTGGQKAVAISSGIGRGALTGAAAGASFGPIGAAVGAVAGAIGGALKSAFGVKARRKERQKRREALLEAYETLQPLLLRNTTYAPPPHGVRSTPDKCIFPSRCLYSTVMNGSTQDVVVGVIEGATNLFYLLPDDPPGPSEEVREMTQRMLAQPQVNWQGLLPPATTSKFFKAVAKDAKLRDWVEKKAPAQRAAETRRKVDVTRVSRRTLLMRKRQKDKKIATIAAAGIGAAAVGWFILR